MAVSGQDSVNFTNQTASFVTRPGPVFVGGQGVPSSDTHLRLTGVAGDEATTPSDTKYDQTATATFYVQVRVQLDDWTPSGTQHLIGRLAVTASGTWRFGITSGGFPLLASTNNGTVTSSATSTVAVPARDGDTVWLRVIVSSSTSQASFYWAPDEPGVPSTWNTLSLNRSTATFPLQASTDPVEIGGRNNGTEPLAGRIYRARILDGSQVAIADFDPGTDWTGSSSWVASATGETWSLTGGATIVSTNPVTSAATGNASATATAFGVAPLVAPVAGFAGATATASPPTETVAPVTGVASATAAGFAPKVSASSIAGVATAAATASAPAETVAPVAGVAGATAAAFNPTASTAAATSASAGAATATAAGFGVQAKVSPTTGGAAGTAQAFGATASDATVAGVASSTGAAFAPAASVRPTTGVASSTAAGSGVAATVSPVAGAAAATASGFNPTASTVATTSASAGAATATGIAYNPAAAIAKSAGFAGATGLAYAATSTVAARADVATATATGFAPSTAVIPPPTITGPFMTLRRTPDRSTDALTPARVTLELADDRQTEAIR